MMPKIYGIYTVSIYYYLAHIFTSCLGTPLVKGKNSEIIFGQTKKYPTPPTPPSPRSNGSRNFRGGGARNIFWPIFYKPGGGYAPSPHPHPPPGSASALITGNTAARDTYSMLIFELKCVLVLIKMYTH